MIRKSIFSLLGACRSTRRKRKFQWRRLGKEDEQKTRRRSRSYVDGFFVKSDAAGRVPLKFAAGGYSDRLLWILIVLLVASCAAQRESSLEEALFSLDGCNARLETTRTKCQTAANEADSIQATEPTNINAALIESSALTGLSRLDFLTFTSNLTDLQDSGTDDFLQFRNIIADYEAELNTDQGTSGLELDLASLHNAIVALEGVLTDIDVNANGVAIDPFVKNASFQLGVLRAIDALVRPSKLASGGVANVVNITEIEMGYTRDDFIGADNSIIIGGGDEDDLSDMFRPIRENYCRCSLQTPLAASAGFTTTCLRDLMRCELYDGNSVEQDYNDDGTVDTVDCLTLLTPDGIDACGGQDTEE